MEGAIEKITKDQLVNRIDAINEDSSLAELKLIIKGQHELILGEETVKDESIKRIKALEDNIQKLMETSVDTKQNEIEVTPAEMDAKFFNGFVKSWRTGDYRHAQNEGGKILGKTTVTGEWGPTIKNFGDMPESMKNPDGTVKAQIGTPLTGDTATGNVLIPTSFASTIDRIAAQASQLMGKVTEVPMASRTFKLNRGGTGATLNWVANENTSKTETNPTFINYDLEAETLAGWIAITEELNEDSEISLAPFFQELFGEAWGVEFDTQLLIAAASPFTGILENAGVVNYIIGNAPGGTLDSTGKTAITDIVFEDFSNMIQLLPSSRRANAVFMLNKTVAAIVRNLKDSQGRFLWFQPAGTQPATIWGFPVVENDRLPSTVVANKPFLALGDPKTLLHGKRIGMEFTIWDKTIKAMEDDELFFRLRLRSAFNSSLPASWIIAETSTT